MNQGILCLLSGLPWLILASCTGDPTPPKAYDPEGADGPGTPLDTASPTDPDDTAAGGETGDTSDPGGPAKDERRFALLEVVGTLVDDPNPLSDETGTTQLYAWKLADWVRQGVDVRWEETVCGMESTEIFGTVTSYPDAFLAALEPVERTATLSSAETGATFVMERQVTVLGAQLEDPWEDPMPEDASDPQQWDQDEDGNPGVTVHVDQELLGEGDVYVAQRTFSAYEGVLYSADRVEGYVDSDNEQVVYDASAWWLEIDTNSRDDPDPSHSWFQFVQVDDAWGCAEILDARDSLFE